MFGRKSLLAVGAVIAGLLLPAQAMAQFEAYTRVDLNLRVGPGTAYGVIDVIPYGDPVDVLGCLDGIEWCDVEWYGLRGWVAAMYLVQPGTSVYLPQVYARIGVPIISFSFGSYHDRHYRDRPWYKKRSGRWRGEDWRRGDRPRQRRQETERPRQRQETERPRQRQETERPRQRQETERPRQRQETQRPRQQQEQQEAGQPRRGERTQRPRQNEETEQSGRSQRAKKKGRSRDRVEEEELEERGQ